MIIDMHADTFSVLGSKELYSNDLMVDIKKMQKGNYLAQLFAIFVDNKKSDYPLKEYIDLISKYKYEINKNHLYIKESLNYKDIISNRKQNIISSILTIEGADFIKSINDIENLYDMGVRLITLTWNYKNMIGSPSSNSNEGLSGFGIEVIKKMNDLGIIIDVSHLSDQGFYDCVKYSEKPVVASHSNCRELCNNPRNLTDDMIITLDKKKGLIGINYYSKFVDEAKDMTYVSDLVRHIKHIKNIASADVIGLGSDFDGFDSTLEMNDSSKMYMLIYELLKEGFTKEEIDKITHLNFLRVFKEVVG